MTTNATEGSPLTASNHKISKQALLFAFIALVSEGLKPNINNDPYSQLYLNRTEDNQLCYDFDFIKSF